MKFPGITLTGADERSDIAELRRLCAISPSVEIGVLLSLSPEGRNRYPGFAKIWQIVEALGPQAAVHICGSQARAGLLRTSYDAFGLRWLRSAGRIQVNGMVSIADLQKIKDLLKPVPIITQATQKNASLTRVSIQGHSLLVDDSGGRGRSPASWSRPETSKPVGFAGGLGPDSLADELPRIAAVATGDWWVDMESRLRDEGDWFSITRAEKCITVFQEWKRSR